MLCPDQCWSLSHNLPDKNRSGIHIEQSYLFTALASLAVNANRGEKLRLARLDQEWTHTDSRSIVDVLHFVGALRDDLIVQ